MKKMTAKRARMERQYRKIQREIAEERDRCCEGCGRTDCRITFSHRLPRSRRLDLLCDKNNIDLMCLTCHEFVEAGKFHLLANGEEIMKYLKATDPEYYQIQIAKDWISQS